MRSHKVIAHTAACLAVLGGLALAKPSVVHAAPGAGSRVSSSNFDFNSTEGFADHKDATSASKLTNDQVKDYADKSNKYNSDYQTYLDAMQNANQKWIDLQNVKHAGHNQGSVEYTAADNALAEAQQQQRDAQKQADASKKAAQDSFGATVKADGITKGKKSALESNLTTLNNKDASVTCSIANYQQIVDNQKDQLKTKREAAYSSANDQKLAKAYEDAYAAYYKANKQFIKDHPGQTLTYGDEWTAYQKAYNALPGTSSASWGDYQGALDQLLQYKDNLSQAKKDADKYQVKLDS